MSPYRPTFSLATLQVFVAVARLGSFTRAAESVHLTQSAVSKHIGMLEDNLGVPLLTRAGGVSLTEPGRQFLHAVEPALEQIMRAAERIARPDAQPSVVNLLAPPAVLQYWLIPLLPCLAREHADIDLRLTPRLVSLPSPRLDLDADIRFGTGIWQGVRARYLFGREMCVVASPGLLAARPVTRPEDLLRVKRLSHVLYPSAWSEWSQAMGTGVALPDDEQAYDHYSVMIAALRAQLGVGILPRLLVRKHLASGELVAPFDEVMMGSSGYYLVLSEHDATASATLRRLGNWLKARADELSEQWLTGVSISVEYEPGKARSNGRR